MECRESGNSILTREQVLALDIATHTGYFSLHEAGVWNFTGVEAPQRQQDAWRVPHDAPRLHAPLRHPAGRGRRRVDEPPFLRHAPSVGTAGNFTRSLRRTGPSRAGVRQFGHAQKMGDGRRSCHQGADDRRMQEQVRNSPHR